MLSQKEIHSSFSKNEIINRRVFLLAAAKIVLFGGMTYRLFNLQISDREKYLLLSDKNRLREWKTPPQRGIITDYFNNVITYTVESGRMSQQGAEAYFNYNSYLIQGIFFSLAMGIVTSAIVSIFVKKKAKAGATTLNH